MNAYIIDPDTKTITTHEFDGQLNSIYTLFNSILIDTSHELHQHVIYTDEYAIDQNKTPFFIAEKLFLGRALICGINGLEEEDVKISVDELHTLISYDINDFYTQCLQVLTQAKMNFNTHFTLTYENEKTDLSYEWVIYTFNMADERTQTYFLEKLNETLAQNGDIDAYFQNMAQRAIEAMN
jgi:hypothetical protein